MCRSQVVVIGAKEYAMWCRACTLAVSMRVCGACRFRGSWTKEVHNERQAQSQRTGLSQHPVPVGFFSPTGKPNHQEADHKLQVDEFVAADLRGAT